MYTQKRRVRRQRMSVRAMYAQIDIVKRGRKRDRLAMDGTSKDESEQEATKRAGSPLEPDQTIHLAAGRTLRAGFGEQFAACQQGVALRLFVLSCQLGLLSVQFVSQCNKKAGAEQVKKPKKTAMIAPKVVEQSVANQALHLLFNGGGIVCSYTAFSILQEEITRDKYGPNKERFTFMQELVFFQLLVFVIVSSIFKPSSKTSAATVPWYYYAIGAVSYMLAMLSSNTALEFVPYPTQVLCKSCKPLPVLLFGVFFAAKRYAWRKYVYVTCIVVGMAVFMYKKQHSAKFDVLSFGTGEALLLFSLAMDGVTGTVQERMRSSYTTEKWTMMFYMNLFSSLFLAATMLVSNEIPKFVAFLQLYPFVLRRMLFLSIAGAVGQVFIFKTVSEFGPLTLSIITTSRKLISVVLSVIIFSNPFSTNQAIGTIIVFSALFADAYDSSRGKKAPVKAETEPPVEAPPVADAAGDGATRRKAARRQD